MPRLVSGWLLVVGASVGQLRGRDVQDAGPGTLRDHVHEAQPVLVRVPEAMPRLIPDSTMDAERDR